MFNDFQTVNSVSDAIRVKEISDAAAMVQRFTDTLARLYAEEHPTDPVVDGWRAAKERLDELTDAGIVRGHLKLAEAITR